jgi:regulatory protein
MEAEIDILMGKARSYCAYQERCITEVNAKLKDWKAPEIMAEKVIERLITENYLNEGRFAKTFAGSKFRNNKWGKTRIVHELRQRRIPDELIREAVEELVDEDYTNVLINLLAKKSKEIREPDPFRKKQKLIAFAVQKGFTYDEARKAATELIDKTN